MLSFQTDRLQLEIIHPSDFDEILEIFNEEGIFEYIAPLQGLSRVEHVLKLHRKVNEAKNKEGYIWAVRELDSNRLVGLINLNQLPDTHDIQIGWILSSQFQGKGYAYESAKVVFDYGVNDWKVNPIFAIVEDGNIPSEKIALKLGLEFRHYFTQDDVKLKLFSYCK
ncbi:GNAT family N-acetyltransferase [Flammeovirga sp. EKP202]|uniref:GNAT family N-acetyltransferase n=1 Tax=Flammeovirga sp. EKP202 TaxID=2770592 RepID=UPI00165F5322|nr:GNAT family N-acetyltransferase [Flammeovirga sp. EKP202]MBD0399999.1 GNAT family N-acetyltransferase [Flammeovirga sp. EKP202]